MINPGFTAARTVLHLTLLLCLAAATASSQWPPPRSPVIPEADGYIPIPNAAERPERDHVYKVIFDATEFPEHPTELLPALNNAGSELNALGVEAVPRENWKFAIVFHGAAIDGILDEEHYKEKFGVDNPNLNVLAEMKREGVELLVCGQNVAADKISPSSLSNDVMIASDALIVLMHYQHKGYALLNF